MAGAGSIMKWLGITDLSETGMYPLQGNHWQHPVLARAEFPDGIIRTVRLNQQADTFFSWPGRTSYKRHTVRCFVTCDGPIEGRVYGHYDTSSLQEYITPTGNDR